MKKLIKIIVAIIGIYFVFQFVVNLFIKTHDINYSMVKDNITYDINEIYNEDGYFFKATDTGKNNYLFIYDYDYNKQEKVISNIKHYNSNDLNCILPIYKNNRTGNLACNLKNKPVSYSYLKQVNNTDIDNIISNVRKDGYESDEGSYSKEKTATDNIFVYKKNLDDNFIYTLWFYRGIYIINNKDIIKKDYLMKDCYENKYSSLVGKYYVTFNTDNLNDFKIYNIIAYNIQDGGSKNIDVSFSSNIYINGVVDKKLYYTDLDSKTQYCFDPYDGKNEALDKYYTYSKNELQEIDSVNFFEENIIYPTTAENRKITEKYGNVEIKKYGLIYYYKTDDGEVYSIINNDYNNPVKLFQFSDLKDWGVINGVVYGISKDTIYTYTAKNGLRPIIINSELQYNYKNIFDFMKK